MITFIFLAIVALVAIGGVYLAMSAGNKGGRNNQSGQAAATKQEQLSNPRGDVRSTGSGND